MKILSLSLLIVMRRLTTKSVRCRLWLETRNQETCYCVLKKAQILRNKGYRYLPSSGYGLYLFVFTHSFELFQMTDKTGPYASMFISIVNLNMPSENAS